MYSGFWPGGKAYWTCNLALTPSIGVTMKLRRAPVLEPQNITCGIVGCEFSGCFLSQYFLHIPISPNMVEFMHPVRNIGGVAPLYNPRNCKVMKKNEYAFFYTILYYTPSSFSVTIKQWMGPLKRPWTPCVWRRTFTVSNACPASTRATPEADPAIKCFK